MRFLWEIKLINTWFLDLKCRPALLLHKLINNQSESCKEDMFALSSKCSLIYYVSLFSQLFYLVEIVGNFHSN